MSEHEITSRIRRDELLPLLHSTGAQPPITARMPAVTLETLLVPDELPEPPFVIRFRTPAGTDQQTPIECAESNGAIEDDIDPEVSVAISRVTSQSLNATIDAAIDAAVDAATSAPVDEAVQAVIATVEPPESRRDTAILMRYVRAERFKMLPMFCGFALTFVAGIALMMMIG